MNATQTTTSGSAVSGGIEKKRIQVLGQRMAYVERGAGAPMVFLHGNPTSSYLWRDILGPLSTHYRCIAPDLIGMGDSDKLAETGPDAYSFFRHREFVDAFLEAVVPDQKIILVIHDWGSALGFDWARRHPERVRAIAYMEAIVGVMSWSEWAEAERALFQRFRSPEGEKLVLEDNVFVERVLPGNVLRTLDERTLAEYRRPFLTPGESRRPTLSFPRQLPIDGSPPEVSAEVEKYAQWMPTTTFPKLFVNAEPGRILTGRLRETCRRWLNQRELTVPGRHFLQEDSSPAIAEAIEAWARSFT
ncbi:haloalkane dehalogenase [Labilithrix luteola]|uniref:Haloalkane dehalogenase n=1 Tax=Labilithrix luteola TaxID=1391654 RepID=A0A0K1PYN8_9BACT|nr:haloalkane dehalogenase [Labilithrix luteola]AKU98249.1 haloalkane dehalogenase [Labilithrix luteola]